MNIILSDRNQPHDKLEDVKRDKEQELDRYRSLVSLECRRENDSHAAHDKDAEPEPVTVVDAHLIERTVDLGVLDVQRQQVDLLHFGLNSFYFLDKVRRE